VFLKSLRGNQSRIAGCAGGKPGGRRESAGNTTWCLSNAISWVAGQTENAERKLDLMKVAGEVLPKAA